MATIRSESSTLQYIAVTAQSGQVNLTSDHHPLLSPGIKCTEAVAAAGSSLSPTPGHKSNQQGRNHPQEFPPCTCSSTNSQSPGWGGFGFGVLYTKTVHELIFVGLGGGRQRKQAGLFKELHRPVPPDHLFPLQALLCSGWLAGGHGRQLQSEVRIGLHGPLQAPTRRRPQWGAPSSCCLANLKPWLP